MSFSEKGVNLSNMTQFVPSVQSRRKVVHLNLHALKQLGFTHVIARLPAASTNVSVFLIVRCFLR